MNNNNEEDLKFSPRKILFLVFVLVFAGETSCQWLTGFTYRKKIEIEEDEVYGSEDLDNYPLLVSLMDPDLRSVTQGGLVFSETGWDIRFTTDDGTTLLEHEIELFTASDGELVTWVRIPSLSSSEETEIYLYFGNPSVDSDPSAPGTWSNDFHGVWHFNGNADDASQYANDGTPNGALPAVGMIGNAYWFDGIDDNINIPNHASLNITGDITLEAWARITEETEVNWVITGKHYDYWLWYEDTTLRFYAGETNVIDTIALTTDQWYHVAGTYDGSTMKLYLDGIEIASKPNSTPTSNDSDAPLTIGNYPPTPDPWNFTGDIDEVRISAHAHSGDWIKTSYRNQYNPAQFSSVESGETANDLPCGAIVLPVDSSCSPGIFSNQYATDSGIPLTECEGYAGGDVWFKVEVPATGSFVVRIESDARSQSPAYAGWAHRLGLAVYSGSCGSLTYDTCWISPESPGPPDNPEMVLSGFTPGDTLFLRVWEYGNDFNGKFRICAFSDVEAPTITCPADIESQADSGSCLAALVVPAPVVSSPYGIRTVVNDYNGTDDASDDYPVGSSEVLWTVTDSLGISAFCSHTITVFDNEVPLISCPDDMTAYLDSSCEFIIPDYTGLISYSDNCDPDPLVSQSPVAGTIISGDVSIQQITISVEDSSSNVAQCQFNILLQDTIRPSVTCPGDDTTYLDNNCEYSLPDYTGLISFSDNCDPDPVVSQSPVSGTIITGDVSMQQITISVEDSSSNIAQCQFNIILLDTIKPVVTCPGDITEYINGNCEFSLPDYTNSVSYSDNCDQDPVASQSPIPGTIISGHGTIQPITIQVEDDGGNAVQCRFDIVLLDTLSPVFTCPGEMTEYLDGNCEFLLPDYTGIIPSTDNCDPDPTVTQSPAAGTILSGSGTSQEIVLLARDVLGNESACRFNILLLDNTPPEASSLRDTVVTVEEGTYQTNIIMPLPVFIDNCGVQSVSNDFNGGQDASGEYSFGTTTVIYTVTDWDGNDAQFNQQVQVRFENEPAFGLVIPEGFSPNEDGLNDRFEILGLEQYPDNELRVFNVHGNEVYQMTGYDNSWDGTSASNLNKGGRLPTGTYYYALYLGVENAIVKGFIYLRRE